MAKQQNLHRTTADETPGNLYWEDQWWSVALGLVMFGGLLAGLGVAYLPLEGAPWYRSAWPVLYSVPALTFVVIVALAYFHDRLGSRSVQLALVLCAIFHLALLVQMINTPLLTWGEGTAERAKTPSKRPRLLAPEYHATRLAHEEDRPKQDFERPLPSQTPEPAREERTDKRPEEADRPVEVPKPAEVPIQQATPEASLANRQQQSEAPPRLDDEMSRLARQESATPATPEQNVTLPAAPALPDERAATAPAPIAMAKAAREPAHSEVVPAQSLARAEASASRLASREPAPPTRPKANARIVPRDEPMQPVEGAVSSLPRTGPAVSSPSNAPARVEVPEVGPRSAVAQAELDHSPARVAATRSSPATASSPAASSGPRVEASAPPGPAGIGFEPARSAGLRSRTAKTGGVNIEPTTSRFARSEVGGLPSVSTAAVIPAEAFSTRVARARGQQPLGGRGAVSPDSEQAIERGLAFLARHQRPDGSWSLQGFPEEASLVTNTAATSLALLAFQGAGYHHREFQYRDVVLRGLVYLLKNQQENGDLFIPLDDESNRSVWLYSHSLAAIAICEAYGMTQDPELREPAQKAINFVVASQEPDRGGWRYAPRVGSDTSVSGWMLMALKSGELAGLDVPPDAYNRVIVWLDNAQQPGEPSLYRYNPYASDTQEQRHGRLSSRSMTAVGLLMRLYLGWSRENPNMLRGAVYLAQALPANGSQQQPQRDTYYWYYATQVLAHVGGEPWNAWTSRLHALLVNSQVRQGPMSGSWDPRGPIPDRWGPHAGRLYVTALNLLSLEVQYRKLPLYEGVER